MCLKPELKKNVSIVKPKPEPPSNPRMAVLTLARRSLNKVSYRERPLNTSNYEA